MRGTEANVVQGLTSVQYCSCANGSPCPLQWDQFDGQSVSQAKSDQYKVYTIV